MSSQRRELAADTRSLRRLSVDAGAVADSRSRMRHLLIGFAICLGIVGGRVMLLELSQGRDFRAVAAKPLEKVRPIAGARGAIVSRDGVVLATDRRIASLAVHYRFLEDPANPRWLRRQARARVAPDAPDRAAQLARAHAWVNEYRATLLDRLAQLCGRPLDDLQNESRVIQQRVQAIGVAVNRAHVARRQASLRDSADGQDSWRDLTAVLPPWLLPANDDRAVPRIIVAEELDYHVVVPDISLEVVAEVESRPEAYPGVRIVEQSRRHYPRGSLAANVVGHLGAEEATDATPPPNDSQKATAESEQRARRSRSQLVGRLGLERQYEHALHGRDGEMVDLTDHGGRLLSSIRRSEPVAGREIVLTLDARLEQLAEQRLDHALAQIDRADAAGKTAGGAVVVLEVQTGAILAAATAPRFNPNSFALQDPQSVARLLHDPAHPLFDRTIKMALPPGSVFKIVTALALLDQPGFDPDAVCDCQGFLTRPDRERCQVFRRYGVGHGATTLSDALARSCNVYFFQYAEQLGPTAIADWGKRLGLGRATGVDLPAEAAGALPCDGQGTPPDWRLADTRALAIGQSRLTATPLQVARMMAAIANGGFLVTPHIVATTADYAYPPHSPPTPLPGVGARQLTILRQALERVVTDPDGTAYGALADCGVAVAGKTGTAETGEHSADHAWFVGYAPAEAPRVAFAVVLEHRGSAEHAAALAKELIQGMEALELLAIPHQDELVQAGNQ